MRPPGSPPSPRQRARGALLGLAVGDALGTTLEFSEPVGMPFPHLVHGPQVDITGGGPFQVAPGQVTDDTQMAVCLATSLRARGRFDAADVAARYREWVRLAFDAGNLTRAALVEMERAPSPEQAGYRVWDRGGRGAAGNGSLMRTTPIAVFFSRPEDAAARREAALADSALTHADPRCQLACAAFDAAVAACLQGAETAEAVVDAAALELEEAAPLVAARWPGAREETEAARAALQEDLTAAHAPDPALYGPTLHLHQTQGFVRVAFRLAFWELLHAPSSEAALVDAVNRGGDADTNGAIVGALVGAFAGEEALRPAWRARVLTALEEAPESRWWALYHPRLLLPLVERVPE